MSVTDTVVGMPGVPDYTVTYLRKPKHELALVIPVINENGRLTAQLQRIQAAAPQVDIIIADGGSTDGSAQPESLTERGVTALLIKTGPGGLSAQLRMAIHHCLKGNYRAVVTMDGNGKDGVDGIDSIATALRAGYDFVQGSRFIPNGHAVNTPRGRYLAIRLIHAPVTSLGARHWYTDTTNGFRGHSRRLLADTRVAPLRDVFNTYELLAYLPVQAARLDYRITEVPVTRSYPIGEPTPTKINGGRAYVRMLRILINAAVGTYRPTP